MNTKHNFSKAFSVIVILAMLFSNTQLSSAQAQGRTGDGIKREVNAESGKVSFIGPESGQVLSSAQALDSFARPQDPAMALAKRFAPEFGVQNPERDLSEIRNTQSENGHIKARYQQKYQGIPVMGGELIVNTNENGDLYSMNGEVSPDLSLSIQPTIDSVQARDTALQSIATSYQKNPDDFETTEPELWIYDESLLQPSTRPVELVWRMDVTPKDIGMPVRELVLVNAQQGGISLHFNQIDTAWTGEQPADDLPTATPEPPQSTETPVSTDIPDIEATLVTPLEAQPSADTSTLEESDLLTEDLTNTLYVTNTGSDANDCASTLTPCATINGAIGKAGSGDTIKVAIGTYTGTGTEVVLINKNITLSGGWNATFSTQSGTSIVDGQSARRGMTLSIAITVNVERITVQNGSALQGSGIYNSSGGTLTLTNSTVRNNSGSPITGSGIYNENGLMILTKSIVNGNTGNNGSRGIYNSGGTLILNSSSVIGNTGPGIANSGILATLTLNNSTISRNTGSNGGRGIYNDGGTVTLNNSTISYNVAGYGSGGGIYSSGGAITLRNTIVAANSATTSGPDCSGSITSAGYNLIGNTSGCTFVSGAGDLTNVNANLGEIIGSPGYHPLQTGSPAIDAGNPITPGSDGNACLATDQRGVARPVGAHCDIGTYEYTVPSGVASLSTISGDNQRASVGLAFSNPLKLAALDSQGSPVPNASITFTAPSSGPSGTFASTGNGVTSVLTDTNGIATTSIFTANAIFGSYSIIASATGAASVNFNLQNVSWYVATTGSDTNDCLNPATPCATINGAIGKAGTGDMINIAFGTYTGPGTQVVLINKNITLSGGWNASFTTQSGMTTIDGQNARRGVYLNSNTITVSLDRFIITNAYFYLVGVGISSMGNLTVSNTIIQNSTGGAISNNYGNLTLNNTIIRNNTSGGDGAGIYNLGNLTLNNTVVSNNTITLASTPGGGIYNQGNLTLNNSTVSNNSTFSAGGGIYSVAGSLTTNNSTISGNVASSGGGISAAGGGILLQNTILANNMTFQGFSDCTGAIGSSGHNLIGNNSGCTFTPTTGDLVGTSVSPIKSFLNALQDNGGFTPTHALGIGSPAIDAGNPATCLPNDQRGVARPIGVKCDIGAYEGSVAWMPSPVVITYTANNTSSLPGNFLCLQGQQPCTINNANPHADAAHKYAIGTFDFYAAHFNRDSIDNNGMVIKSTVHYCDPSFGCPYANAFWNGDQMVYGDAYGYPLADDVVAHELTHGVTQYESNLLYYYQSGAINESLSDVFGEYYDQINGLGNDTAGVKWLHGEDVAGRSASRDMRNPPAMGDPDKMTSANYYTGSDDSGGVHTNSGVNNKAVYLMVDGGTFNGKMITALGWDKVGAIYYEANTNLLTSAADFSDLYHALQQACTNLIGQHGIGAGDCVQVQNALDAVEMNTRQFLGNFDDPSFEYSYATYPYWDQSSTNFDSPLCTVADCDNSGGTAGPRTGSVWGWFGGTTAYEAASLSQTVYFPRGYPSPKLKFYFWIGRANAGSDANDSFVAQVDGVTVFSANATQKNSYPAYTQISVDVGAFANNALHTITFSSTTTGQVVNFNLDDVSLFDDSLTITGNAGIADALLSYLDGTPKTVTTDGSGAYAIIVPKGWTGTLMPYKTGHLFTPLNRSYTNVQGNLTAQNYTVLACPTCADINASIGGLPRGAYTLGIAQGSRDSYVNVDDGPAKISSTNGVPLVASTGIFMKRLPNYSSYTELMGLPASKLTDTYIFPWYNNATAGGVQSQLRFGNVGVAETDVTVKIGGVTYGPYHLGLNGSDRRTFDNVDAGPVEVKSSGGVPIIASMRINLKSLPTYSSYSEFMGVSASSTVGTKYLFPWYGNATAGGAQSQLRFGNMGNAETDVTVKIGATTYGPYHLGLNASDRRTFDNVDAGPVEVTSSGGVPIIASMRVNLKTNPTYSSYSEFMGLPGAALTETHYYFPWYNNATAGGLQSQLRFGNVGVAETDVTVKIGGISYGPYHLGLNGSQRIVLDNVDAGPVEVFSSGGVPIIASMRVNLKTNGFYSSYSEFMGLSVGAPLGMPGNELSATYWFPWYNNATAGGLSSLLRFGVP